MNNITIELCQEDRNRIDTLIAVGLELAKKNIYDVQPVAPIEAHQLTVDEMPAHSQTLPKTRQEAAEAANTDTLESAHPVDAVTPWGEPVSEAPAVSGKLGDKGNEKLFAAVQQKVVKLSAAGANKKAAVRGIVQKVAAKVSDIPAAEYDTIMEQLTALEG